MNKTMFKRSVVVTKKTGRCGGGQRRRGDCRRRQGRRRGGGQRRRGDCRRRQGRRCISLLCLLYFHPVTPLSLLLSSLFLLFSSPLLCLSFFLPPPPFRSSPLPQPSLRFVADSLSLNHFFFFHLLQNGLPIDSVSLFRVSQKAFTFVS